MAKDYAVRHPLRKSVSAFASLSAVAFLSVIPKGNLLYPVRL